MGWPRRNFVKTFTADKTRMIGLPYGEENYENMLSRFHLIPERHGQTDGQTDRFAISISGVSVLTRDKNLQPFSQCRHVFCSICLKEIIYNKWRETQQTSPCVPLQGAATWRIWFHDARLIAHLFWKFLDDRLTVFHSVGNRRALFTNKLTNIVTNRLAPFDRSHTGFYSPSIVTMAVFCIVFEITPHYHV